jgi:hypothetical protein
VRVGKGLTRFAALRRAVRARGGDFRGFAYNSRTGIAVLA